MTDWSADVVVGHAAADSWEQALSAVLPQLGVQPAGAALSDAFDTQGRSMLGLIYITEAWATHLHEIVRRFRQRTRVDSWLGAVGLGVCATGVEYIAQPAMVVMIAKLPTRSFQLFGNLQVLARLASSGDDDDARNMSPETLAAPRTSGLLLHADSQTMDYPVQVTDARNLGGSDQTFGGVVERGDSWPTQYADGGVFNGVSGVRFLEPTRFFSRIAQGSVALGSEHVVTHCSARQVVSLDGRPALDVLLADLGAPAPNEDADEQALLQSLQSRQGRRGLYMGIAPADHRHDARFDDTYQVRRLLGLDPRHRAVEISPLPQVGDRVVFCTRDPASARASLVRVCTELREQLESEGRAIRAAFYHGCVVRNRNVFSGGQQSGIELALIRRHLGPVPLIGLYASAQIAGGHVHRYSGVLTALA